VPTERTEERFSKKKEALKFTALRLQRLAVVFAERSGGLLPAPAPLRDTYTGTWCVCHLCAGDMLLGMSRTIYSCLQAPGILPRMRLRHGEERRGTETGTVARYEERKRKKPFGTWHPVLWKAAIKSPLLLHGLHLPLLCGKLLLAFTTRDSLNDIKLPVHYSVFSSG
jgi:hypothetical protein